jgi:hypothetical protein
MSQLELRANLPYSPLRDLQLLEVVQQLHQMVLQESVPVHAQLVRELAE